MDKLLLEGMKKAIPKDSWLFLLDDSQLLKIYEMLNKGTTNSEIIRTCQSIFNIKRKAQLHDLLPDLVQFRTKSLGDKALVKLEEAQQNKAAVDIANRLRGLTSKVDAFGRLNWLVDLQTQRVLSLRDYETKTTIPLDRTTENMVVLEKMLTNLLKAQQELNLDEGPYQITSDTKSKLQGLVEGFKDDGETMIQATHELLKLAEQRSLVLKIDEDGKYSISGQEETETVEVSG